jgi:hypothetical protein
VNLLTCFQLTLLKLVNVTAKCSFFFFFFFQMVFKFVLHFDFLPNKVHSVLGGSCAWTAASAVFVGVVSFARWLEVVWT